MGDRGGYGQQQASRCGQRRCQPTSCHQCNNPVRQSRYLRVGQYKNIVVELDQLIALGIGHILQATVTVFILYGQQSRLFPGPEPGRALFYLHILSRHGFNGLHDIEARHGGHRRRGGVQNRYEHQRPARRFSGVTDLGHGEETNNDVG